MVICYDGEAHRRVLAMRSSAEQRARAALALTRPECFDPELQPLERHRSDVWRAEVLDRVDASGLSGYLKNRIAMARAGVWSSLAYQRVRVGESATAAAQRALAELATIDKSQLTDQDLPAYNDAAMRVGASRWAAEAAPPVAAPAGLGVLAQPGEPGQTCVLLVDAKHGPAAPLARRCTYGTVWAASARPNPGGTALALAVQPLATWRELWVFRKGAEGWTLHVLPPADDAAGPGYVEFAGWVPGTGQLLVAREARDPAHGGHLARSFELLDAGSLATLRRADSPAALAAFRWQDPAWKRVTVSLR